VHGRQYFPYVECPHNPNQPDLEGVVAKGKPSMTSTPPLHRPDVAIMTSSSVAGQGFDWMLHELINLAPRSTVSFHLAFSPQLDATLTGVPS
jgi:hypothetical protein